MVSSNELPRQYDQGSKCRSTEEMVAGIEEKVNSRSDIKEMVVGSMDVKALYPSLLAIPSTQIIAEVFMETNISIEGVSWLEAGKYLAITLTKEEITHLGLQEVVSTRRRVGGQAPGSTTVEVMGKLYREEGEQTPSLFHPPQQAPHRES